MGGVLDKSRQTVAKLAIFLLVAHAIFGASVCCRYAASADNSEFASTRNSLCSVHGFVRLSLDGQFQNNTLPTQPQSPFNNDFPDSQCPVCQSGACQLTIILPPEISFDLAVSKVIKTKEFASLALSHVFVRAYHNRGPPLSLL